MINKKIRNIALTLLLVLTATLLFACQKDEVAPVITGTQDYTVYVGSEAPDYSAGVSAEDDVDGDLTSAIVIDSSAVDLATVGSYDIVYTVTDIAGNEASVTVTIYVEALSVIPTITAPESYTVEVNDDAFDYLEGVSVLDDVDTDLTPVVDDSSVNIAVVGEYQVVITVVDSDLHESFVTVNVSVVDTTKPVITLSEDDWWFEINTITSADYTVGVSALDNYDGDITSNIVIDSSAVNYTKQGIYNVKFTVTDGSGNETTAFKSVQIKDLVAPVITGTKNRQVNLFSTPDYINYSYSTIAASDNLDGNLTSKILVDDSQVDLTQPGTYPLTYYVFDKSGNIGEATVTITVVDRTGPVIYFAHLRNSFLGDEEPDLLAGVTAIDSYSGDVTDSLTVDPGDFDYTTIGVYEVTYTAQDEFGNVTTVSVPWTVPDPADVVLVDQAFAEISMPTEPITTLNLQSTANGLPISWHVSETPYVTDSFNIIQPGVNQGDVQVRFLAIIRSGTYVNTASYYVTIKDLDEVDTTNVSVQSFDYIAMGEEYVTESATVDAFFVNGETLPYVDVETFLMLAQGAIESDELEFAFESGMLTITYTVEYEDIDGSTVSEELYGVLDFEANTFTVKNFNFFEYYISDTTTDYGEGLNYVDQDYQEGHEVTLDFGKYGFDAFTYEYNGKTQYLMPFHIFDVIFFGSTYYDIYYNGDAFYGFDTYQLYDRSDADVLAARVSSDNDLTTPQDVKIDTYNYLTFIMDYFYGKRVVDGIESYREYISQFADDMIFSTNDMTYYRAIFDMVYGLDDLHTSHVFAGYYITTTEASSSTFTLKLADLGDRSQSYYNRYWSVEDMLESAFGSTTSVPESRVTADGKTAIIFIEGFDVDTPTNFKRLLDLLPASVENVVVDISYNGGGNVGAVFRMFGYMTEQTFTYHSQNPEDGSTVTYYIESDYEAYDYNWFVMTSAVSFSAANITASIAKELGIPVIGRDTSGGASSISIMTLPGGSTILISSNSVTSFRGINVDGEYVYTSAEYGVAVDYYLADLYDDAAISALVAQILGN